MYDSEMDYVGNFIKVAVFTLIGILLSHYGVTNCKEWYTLVGFFCLAFAFTGLFMTGYHYFYIGKDR